jgi:uncharacterized protein
MAIKKPKSSSSSAATSTRRTRKPPQDAPKIESIPADVVLAPQAEAPRGAHTRVDRWRQRSRIREMSWAEFDRLVQGMARGIRKSFKPEAVVGLAHGGVFVGGAVASALGVDFFPVRISRRSRDKTPEKKKKPTMTGSVPRELKGLRVLVVDDVAASGETLELACKQLAKIGADEVRTAALVTREDGFQPGFSALCTEELMVFPWDYEPVAEDQRFGGRGR